MAKRPLRHPAALGQIRVDFNLHPLFGPVKLRVDYTFNGHSARAGGSFTSFTFVDGIVTEFTDIGHLLDELFRGGPMSEKGSNSKQVSPMIHGHQIERARPDDGPDLIKLGDVLRIPALRTAAFCSRKPTVPASRLLTIRAIFPSDCAFGELHEARPRWWLPGARNEPHSFRW